MEGMRLEKDSIGTMWVEKDAYYGVQSLRGAQNFTIIEQKLNPYFIKNMVINAIGFIRNHRTRFA